MNATEIGNSLRCLCVVYLRDGQCAENVSFSAEGQRCTSASQDDTQSTSPETQCR